MRIEQMSADLCPNLSLELDFSISKLYHRVIIEYIRPS